MSISDADITIVYQGPVASGTDATADLIRRTRQALPHSPLVLSTWDGCQTSGLDVDHVIFSEDPGGLPGIKRRDGAGEPNNVNRQLRSTQRGLADVATPYAIKIRTDCALDNAAFLQTYEAISAVSPEPRLLTSSLFTIDPLMFEQMPYHVSDWFQFGPSALLRRYWSAPFMSAADASFYERHPYARHSTYLDRRFRTRLAVEQYLAVQFAGGLGYPVPRYHNDLSDGVLVGHRRFLARHVIPVDPWNIRLRFPKYEWAYRSSFQRLNCLLFPDWHDLYLQEGGRPFAAPAARLFRARRARKQAARVLAHWLDRAGPLLVRPLCKHTVNRLLSVLAPPGPSR
ncbi:MAG TPA: WavE lipopolysaccharide synthesis family protein [Nitrospira sp.]|nr:WavE lipopolysaccharide synthesis family protein [Nitrospira sp.]